MYESIYGKRENITVMEKVFESQNIIFAKILKAYKYNKRAIHVYRKCGFITYDANEKEVFMEYVSNI